jgi:transposase
VTRVPAHFYLRYDQLIGETLMIALGMKMRQILPQNMTQRRLTHDDHPIQRFLFDQAHEPLAIGIQIGTPWWQHDRLHAAVAQGLVERIFNRFKSHVHIAPMFVTRNDHIEGLTRLLTLGVRVLTVMECVLRRSLHFLEG